MDNSVFNIWALLAGLGFFLFGMELLETSLKSLAGRTFRDFLKRNTETKMRGIFSGAFVTAILQSSTLVSLMILAFVGAELIKMSSAIAVILGTNLGTTATGWFFALVGLKLNIQQFSYVLLGLGALVRLVTSQDSESFWKRMLFQIAQFTLGLALLLIGLDTMKNAIELLALNYDLSKFQHLHYTLYALIGLILTALIQSSSATMAITLSALFSGAILLNQAAGVIAGAYIGTTFTVLLGAIGASTDRKRVAVAHFLFNLTTAAIALPLIPLLILLISDVLHVKDPLIALVSFHTMISTLGILIFYPLIKKMAYFLLWFIPNKEEKKYATYISGLTASIHGPVIEALEKEVLSFAARVLDFCPKIYDKTHASPYRYQAIKNHSGEIFEFSYNLLESPDIRESEIKRIQGLMRSTRFFLASAKTFKDITHNMEELEQSGHAETKRILDQLIEKALLSINQLKKFTFQLEGENKLMELSFEETESEIPWSKIEGIKIPTMINVLRETTTGLEQLNKAVLLYKEAVNTHSTPDVPE